VARIGTSLPPGSATRLWHNGALPNQCVTLSARGGRLAAS
jgi:hypothetical protein